MRFRFLTSTPLDIRRGSGSYVGLALLRRSLEALGHAVTVESPHVRLPIFTFERLLFNRGLKPDPSFDVTIGFDMDGYRVAKNAGHVALLQGVIADEARFERGLTRATMLLQARCEREHVRRASLVTTTSRYSAAMARDLYGLSDLPAVVPVGIDLAHWQSLLEANPAPRVEGRFTVLSVGRLYRRKRVEVLLEAAARLRETIRGLEVRIVGRGPQEAELKALWRKLRLEDTVHFLGDVARTELARQYNECQVFCHPSVQEGFGIVFLEAMAAGKPIVATRAGAAPEVVTNGVLVAPDDAEALAAGIESLYRLPERCAELGIAGRKRVAKFDAPLVADSFLRAILPASGGRRIL